MSSILEVGEAVSFQTHADTLLGGGFTNVEVVSIVSHEVARMLGFSPAEMHANVYPKLPEGSIDDHRRYNYAVVKQAGGGTRLVGLPWIKTTSIVRNNKNTITIQVKTISTNDVALITNALVANGFKLEQITITET